MLSVARAFAEFYGDVHFFAAAIESDGYGVAGPLAVECEVDVKLTRDFLSVNRHNHVAANGDALHARLCDTIASVNAGGSSRPAFYGPLHQQPFLHGQIQRFAEPTADGECLHAEVCEVDAAVKGGPAATAGI